MPVALRRGDVVRIRDERWAVDRREDHGSAAIVDVRGCDRANRGVRARFLLPFEPIDRLPAPDRTQVVSRRRWRHRARRVLASAVPHYGSLRVLARARADILPFQLEPALAVVGGVATRLLVADEVGLGKTVEAGLVIAETLERDARARALVVCPASLRRQWHDELAARFDLHAELFDSAALARGGAEALPGRNPWAAHRLIVTSVDYAKRPEVLRALESIVWDLLVIDEAHALTGWSERHDAATVLGARARVIVMLTATPHSGDDEAFSRLCAVGDLEGRFPLALFRRTRHDAGFAARRRTVWLRVALDPAEAAMHAALIRYARLVWQERGAHPGARLAVAVLLRRASSSATALASSIGRRLALLDTDADPALQPSLPFDSTPDADEEPDAELAAPGLRDGRRERRLLETILSLARAAQGRERKLHALRRLLRRTAEPAIVFTEYRDTLALLARELQEFGCDTLHGGLSDDERRDVLHRFTAGPVRVLLATDAAGEGLNLHARCRLVAHLEVPWTPLRLEQRVGRVDRIGQTRRVHQVLLLAAETPEETTVAPHVRERARHISRTFAAMRSAEREEREIADAILGSTPAHESTDDIEMPPSVFMPDLRADAEAEAARARVARALGVGREDDIPAGAPFGTAAARRIRGGICAFRVTLGPSDEETAWETILAASFETGRRHVRRPADVRAVLEAAAYALQSTVARHEVFVTGPSPAALEAATRLAIARERAIATALGRQHARLAATLIQRGLFDRRLERASAARREVLEKAIAACREHLACLHGRTAVHIHVEPAFGVLLP